MAAFSSFLNRRFSMVFLACLVVPFIVVTLSHLGYTDLSQNSTTLDPLNKPPSQKSPPNIETPAGDQKKEEPAPLKPIPPVKQEWTDMQFTKDVKPTEPTAEKPPTPPPTTQQQPPATQEQPAAAGDKQPVDIVAAVRNETLGFGAVLLLSLKTRTDRQDAVALIGSSQGIKVTHVIDAVRGEDIHQKAYPHGAARTELPLPYLGSWRSHMNAFRYIIENNIETALLLEDDIDWDIYVKDQMTSLSIAMRSSPLRKLLSDDEVKRAPYGLDWDVLHLGTSKNTLAPPPYNNLFHRYEDPRSTPRKLINKNSACGEREFFCWHDILKQTGTTDKERVLFPSYQPVGLVAIAVSFQGAQKMLYDLSWNRLDTSIDYGIRDGCQRGFLKGWSITPPIMSSWRVNGAGDSDLRNGGKGAPGPGVGNLQGEGIGLGWSARKHMQQEFDSHNYWKDGSIGWYAKEKPPIPDNTFANSAGTPPGVSEQSNKQAAPIKGQEKPNTPAAPQHEEPHQEQHEQSPQPEKEETKPETQQEPHKEEEPHSQAPPPTQEQPPQPSSEQQASKTEEKPPNPPGADGHFRPNLDDDPHREPHDDEPKEEDPASETEEKPVEEPPNTEKPAGPHSHEEVDEELEQQIPKKPKEQPTSAPKPPPGEDDAFARKERR